MNFASLFSTQASDYAQFRPRYPEELFSYLASISPSKDLVWDSGTGSGQAAVMLASHFRSVIATDPSEKQLLNAEKNPRVIYKQASAEAAPLEPQSADLITAAQAFHWFNHERFFQEAKRVLKPQGVVAIWTYNLCKIAPEIDQIIEKFYGQILGPYWEKERQLVEEGYRKSIFPLNELSPPEFQMKAEWTFEHLIGYLGTWSALQAYIKKNGQNPLEPLARSIHEVWDDQRTRLVSWELSMRVGR
jgi:SAM-dependent methyltransferase